MTSKRPRTPAPDNLCNSATDLAREAARELGGDAVGAYLGAQAEGDRVVTHYFESTLPGYVGWRWAVTVARASRQRSVTVDEVVMLPGTDALLAPQWVPWSERLRPGDLGVGDILPTSPDDDRLVPSYVDSGDPEVEELAWELGVGRRRVMSRIGRTDAAERWYSADAGPDTPMARSAPGRCGTCGFYLPLAGALRAMFGACGNEYSPADGQVVSADHGCGAHSEASVESGSPEPVPVVVYDDTAIEAVPEADAKARPEAGPEADPESGFGSGPESGDEVVSGTSPEAVSTDSGAMPAAEAEGAPEAGTQAGTQAVDSEAVPEAVGPAGATRRTRRRG